MTRSMPALAVGSLALPPLRLGEKVVAFPQGLCMFDVPSTPCAASALPREQDGPFAQRCWMSAPSARPVDPVLVVRATRARDFRVPTDRRGPRPFPRDPVRGFERPWPLAPVPGLLTAPPRRFVRMTTACPAPQVGIECGLQTDEGLFGSPRRLVVPPSSDEGVEALDEHLLQGRSQTSHVIH